MTQSLMVIVSLIAGVFLGAVSNWVYDLLKDKGVFPNKPRLKHFLVVFLAVLPLLLLVALPQITNLPLFQNRNLPEPWVRIVEVVPSPDQTIFKTNVATPVIVTVDYRLPEEYVFADLRLAYTCLLYTSPSPRDLSTSRMPSSA